MTARTAVFGYPVQHSLSPLLHNALYKAEGIDAHMEAVEVKEVLEVAATIRETPIELSAITIPHKETIIAQLDEVDPVALKIGAVNTVVNRDNVLYGYNTDIEGIAATLAPFELKDKSVLLIGAGGAARPVAYYLQQHEARMFCFNRTSEKAARIVSHFGGEAISGPKLLNHRFDLIINTTSVGMHPDIGQSPIPKEVIAKDSVVFDIIYTPLKTQILKDAKIRGATAINGVTMFIAQALAQERYWRGTDFPDRGYTDLITQRLLQPIVSNL